MFNNLFSSNEKGHLVIGGCDTVELAAQFGTPLYVLDENAIRENCRRYKQSLAQNYPDTMPAFAGKSFLTKAMCSLLAQEGMALDTVSGGEIYTALQAGFPAEKIIFHGNNKSEAEINLALDSGVGRLVVDSTAELHLLSQLATARDKAAAIYLRVNPAVTPDTHSYIQTGQVDSKFGFAIDDQIDEAVKLALSLPGLSLMGLHCHIGSQILDLTPFRKMAEAMVDLLNRVRQDAGVLLGELDLGGGLGIRYLPTDQPPAIEDYAQVITSALKESAAKYNLPLPKLLVEPGRSIVGPAGITLFTVGSEKEVTGVRKYVAVDGGMTTDLRPALYDARYHAFVANRVNEPATEKVTIAGKACESGDILIKDIELPKLHRGDILALLATGAYHYSMASNYNRFGRPAVVFVRDGDANLIVNRETYADLCSNDLLPAHLQTK
ncbi:MAG: diaminopimelate decarboxylase [Firmicutes bacterium]|nr:diaminopimelate decarboxylase [Bacillota bacterium]